MLGAQAELRLYRVMPFGEMDRRSSAEVWAHGREMACRQWRLQVGSDWAARNEDHELRVEVLEPPRGLHGGPLEWKRVFFDPGPDWEAEGRQVEVEVRGAKYLVALGECSAIVRGTPAAVAGGDAFLAAVRKARPRGAQYRAAPCEGAGGTASFWIGPDLHWQIAAYNLSDRGPGGYDIPDTLEGALTARFTGPDGAAGAVERVTVLVWAARFQVVGEGWRTLDLDTAGLERRMAGLAEG